MEVRGTVRGRLPEVAWGTGMKRVWVYSNEKQACGIAEYGRDLQQVLSSSYQTGLGMQPMGHWDVTIVNWHNAVTDVAPKTIRDWQGSGSKVIVMLHNSWEGIHLGSPETDLLAQADCIVAHEPMSFTPSPKKFRYIKQGLTSIDGLPDVVDDSIGTAGFPFAWKRFDLVACVARELGVRCRMIAPRHDSQNTDQLMHGIAGHLGHLADIRRNWMAKEDVVRELAQCTLNIFWYESDDVREQLGQSGSVLMGVSAGRPMIISQHRKMRVLLSEYSDEFYVAQTVDEVYRLAKQIFTLSEDQLRKPVRCRREMCWQNVAHDWVGLIEEMTA